MQKKWTLIYKNRLKRENITDSREKKKKPSIFSILNGPQSIIQWTSYYKKWTLIYKNMDSNQNTYQIHKKEAMVHSLYLMDYKE